MEAFEDIMDHVVFFGESIDDGLELFLARSKMRKDVAVLETVVQRDHSVVGGAVRSDRPVVLTDGELVERRHGIARDDGPGLHAVDELANLDEFITQMVMHGDEVRADRAAKSGVRDLGR